MALMELCERRSVSTEAVQEPRKRAPEPELLAPLGRISCMGVQMASQTSGENESERSIF